MKEITSYQIDLAKKLNTKEIADLYKYVSSSNYDVYFYQTGHIADAKKFPKLVSFFLLTKIKKPIVAIIDGENPEKAFQDIKLLLNQHVKRSIIRTKQTKADTSVVI